MDIRQFSQRVAAKQRQIAQLLQRRLPVVVGRLAKNHYQNNFRQSGFVDHGLHPWQPAKRQNGGAGAAARYRTLLSSRNHLFSSINYTPANAAVTVYNNVPYAAAHNDGATVNIPVTSKMRRYAWAKFYEASGKTKKKTQKQKKQTGPPTPGHSSGATSHSQKKQHSPYAYPNAASSGPHTNSTRKSTHKSLRNSGKYSTPEKQIGTRFIASNCP